MRWILNLCCIALVGMSAVTFCVFAWDKRCAGRGKRRVPERTLLLLCALLSAAGGLAGMRLCHHKTKKAPFPYVVPLLCIVQGALILALAAFC